MPKYNIEGNIDFYGSLYSSLDYDSDKDNDKDNDKDKDPEMVDKKLLCEITGSKLTTNFVTLECKHTFNYDAIYTEICKQKFEFHSYTPDVLSKTDITKIRDSKLDYYIKCPYCRNIQFELLPHYEELGFQKKYGVNTNDIDFREVKTSYVPSSLPANYTYMLYGYKFVKGACCKTTLVNGKVVPCWNTFTTPIAAPDGSMKELCPIHVKPEVKAYKLEIKKKAIEDKLKAKALSAALIAAKKEAISAKGAATKGAATKGATTKGATTKGAATKGATTTNKKEEPTICFSCSALLKTGLRKGEACGQKATSENNLCKRHAAK